CLETASQFLAKPSDVTRDGVRRYVTVSERNRLKETLRRFGEATAPGSEPLTFVPLLKVLQGASPSSKVMSITYQDHSLRERPSLGTMKHTNPDTQESSRKSVSRHYISPSKHILKAKAKPFPPCTHYGFNDDRHDDCHMYPECEIYGSINNATSGLNHAILVRRGALAESSQASESLVGMSCDTYVLGGNHSSTKQINSSQQLIVFMSLLPTSEKKRKTKTHIVTKSKPKLQGPEASRALLKKGKKAKTSMTTLIQTTLKLNHQTVSSGATDTSQSTSSSQSTDPQDIEGNIRPTDSEGNIHFADKGLPATNIDRGTRKSQPLLEGTATDPKDLDRNTQPTDKGLPSMVTNLLRASTKLFEPHEADSTLKETMKTMSKTNTTTSANITDLTKILRNVKLPKIMNQLNGFQTSINSLGSYYASISESFKEDPKFNQRLLKEVEGYIQNFIRLIEIARSFKELNFPSVQTRIINIKNTKVTIHFDVDSIKTSTSAIKEMVTERFQDFNGFSSSIPSGSTFMPTVTPLEATTIVGVNFEKQIIVCSKGGKEFLKKQDAEYNVLYREHMSKLKKKRELKKKRFKQYVSTTKNRLKPEKITDIHIHPNTKPVAIIFYKNNDQRNFNVYKPFGFGDFSVTEWDELGAIIPKKKNKVVKELMISLSKKYKVLKEIPGELRINPSFPPKQVPTLSSSRKRKALKLEPKVCTAGLECDRSILEGIQFVNNKVIETHQSMGSYSLMLLVIMLSKG
nr:retrovirus-related Pol polyprotein from transposon TNT 1-94 [Tanacetum cinerariifolium]